ncbi:hypothetical protein GRX01_00315 [Halobaculum sp. WSA2]|uniref:Envelope protein N-terminal domain-containing protein n=1 Tax=Halobaculum saliterrae TaxID=2073113 RepID=A0A6B0SM61_9EURY|nr:hypothetical protein [Halobaculum saliterrae]MXR39805.1 hypothetical protein [Halobaculum saliterrae]
MRLERLALTYSAVASLAAAGFLTLRGEWIAPSILSVVALGLVGVRIGLDADLREVVASITPRRERIGAAVVALLLVTTALGAPFAGGPVQPAAATHECSKTEQLVTFSFGLTGYAADQLVRKGECTDSHRAQAIEDMEESDANQTHLDIYNAALEQRAETRTQTAVYDNYLNDTESAAWMQAEMAIAEAYENGSSKAVAKSKAREAIAKYYAVKQVNLIEHWNASAESLNTSARIARNESELDQDAVFSATGSVNDPYNPTEKRFEDVDKQGRVTLVNGSEWGARRIIAETWEGGNGNTRTHPATITDHYVAGSWDAQGGNTITYNITGMRVEPPNDNYDAYTYVRYSDYASRWDRMEAQNDALQEEADVFVNNTWEAYESGEIDSADVLSRNTQMFRYGNAALNGSESTYDVTAALSSMGLASPELNGTGSMVVQYQNTEYNGLILARNAPSGGWDSGTTYNTSNITGPVLLATTGGETIELDGEFSVASITAEDGSEIERVETRKVVYKTSNTSEQLDKMNRILELREEIESREPKASGTAETNEGFFEYIAQLLGVSVGAAAAIIAVAGLLYFKLTTPS